MQAAIELFQKALLDLDRVEAGRILAQAGATLTPVAIAGEIVARALERIGDAWQSGEVSLSEVYMSGRICEELIDAILPPADPARIGQPKMAITVLRDSHMLGKRIVYSMLRSSGYGLLDYGRASVDELVERVLEDGVKILLISALMYPSALEVKQVRAKLDQAGAAVKILVGGAPFNMDRELWRAVCADGMGLDAAEAVSLVEQTIQAAGGIP
ncbi:MAG: B12-binding domain-containing protein [Bryobacteraceae bacterium]